MPTLIVAAACFLGVVLFKVYNPAELRHQHTHTQLPVDPDEAGGLTASVAVAAPQLVLLVGAMFTGLLRVDAWIVRKLSENLNTLTTLLIGKRFLESVTGCLEIALFCFLAQQNLLNTPALYLLVVFFVLFSMLFSAFFVVRCHHEVQHVLASAGSLWTHNVMLNPEVQVTYPLCAHACMCMCVCVLEDRVVSLSFLIRSGWTRQSSATKSCGRHSTSRACL